MVTSCVALFLFPVKSFSAPLQPLGLQLPTRDERDGELSVRTRKLPAYNPLNMRFGQFILKPAVTVFTRYADNVYGTKDNKDSDILYGARPEVEITSDFLRHQLGTKLSFEEGRYKKLEEENYRDYTAEISGRYDIDQGFAIPLSLNYAQAHSRRDDPEDRNTIDPTVYHVFASKTGLKLTGHLMELNMGAGFQAIKYDDTTSLSGLAIDNSDRDRHALTVTALAGYPQDAIVAPFLYASHKLTRYDQARDNLAISRDSDETETGIGSSFNLNSVTSSSFRLGYVKREFDSSELSSIDALTYSLSLNWDPSTLAAFSLSGDRFIRETSTDAAAQIQTSLRLGMTYELQPNIILTPQLSYIEKEYEQRSGGKSKSYMADLGIIYKMTRNIWALFNYQGVSEKEEGDPGGAGSGGYDSNEFNLSLKFQL